MSQKVLIVEDDPKIAELVAKNLVASGLECHRVMDGRAALDQYEQIHPSLVILDLNIPSIDGLEVCRRIREDGNVPILMLTARSSESDKVLGFEIGADDYLTKPFSTRELVARVRALLRRAGTGVELEVVRRGEIMIDPGRRVVERSGEPLELTTLEFDLIQFLANRPGRVYTRDQLLEQVWGHDRIVDDRSIDSLVSRLRRKLEADPSRPRYIQTVWGAGYRFGESS